MAYTLAEYLALKEKISSLEIGPERNDLVPLLWEMEKSVDFGFEVGETVKRRTEKQWMIDTIRAIEGNKVHFDSGIMPHCLLRKLEPQKPPGTIEQLTLF